MRCKRGSGFDRLAYIEISQLSEGDSALELLGIYQLKGVSVWLWRCR